MDKFYRNPGYFQTSRLLTISPSSKLTALRLHLSCMSRPDSLRVWTSTPAPQRGLSLCPPAFFWLLPSVVHIPLSTFHSSQSTVHILLSTVRRQTSSPHADHIPSQHSPTNNVSFCRLPFPEFPGKTGGKRYESLRMGDILLPAPMDSPHKRRMRLSVGRGGEGRGQGLWWVLKGGNRRLEILKYRGRYADLDREKQRSW